MIFNVVDAYTYKNYTYEINWPFIHLINACLGAEQKSIKMSLVNNAAYPSDIKLLNGVYIFV